MSFTLDQIQSTVEDLFSKFDINKDGVLEKNEVELLINSCLKQFGVQRQATQQEIR